MQKKGSECEKNIRLGCCCYKEKKDRCLKSMWLKGDWEHAVEFKYGGFVLNESNTDGGENCKKYRILDKNGKELCGVEKGIYIKRLKEVVWKYWKNRE